MQGKVVVVTGANSGIGKATCEQVAKLAAHVVLVCRNEARGQRAIDDLKAKTGSSTFELIVADLAQMAEVRRTAGEIRSRHSKIDVLVNNAGVYLPNRSVTQDGLETMFALNHLAVFLLTKELMDPLAAAAPSRVITVSSGGHLGGHINFDDLQMEKRWSGLRQYCNTKLANVLFTRELARRVKERNIVAHAYHPGSVRTGFAQDEGGWFGWLVKIVGPFLRTADKAARTATFLASDPDALRTSGDYFINSKRRRPSTEALDDAVASRFWSVSEALIASTAHRRK